MVIGRNERERLVRCLRLLLRDGVRIVHVDTDLTDGSMDAARANGAHVVPLDLSVPFRAARTPNAGLAALSGLEGTMDHVQFIDGDCERDPHWIVTALDFLEQNPQVAVVCGRRRELCPDSSINRAPWDREWNTLVCRTEACGGDALIHCSAVEDAGGCDSALVAGEEPELCARLRAQRWTIWRIDAEMTRHDAAMTRFRQRRLRSVPGGFSYAQVWITMRGKALRLFETQLLRSLVWGAALPLMIVAATALWWPTAIVLSLIYPLHIVRVALQSGGQASDWPYVTFMTIAKFAEPAGAIRFAIESYVGRSHAPQSYK